MIHLKKGLVAAALVATSASAMAQAQDSAKTDTIARMKGQNEQKVQEVRVTGHRLRNTEAAAIQIAKQSDVIVSNISAQEIRKTQDSNAGEVIRRVPGVSLIDGKFVMVRGLSQRYNNVWLNGGAVPSSEADSRAFSFDIIPSGQLDNLMVVKSPSPEYPADFSGGFILLNTKDIPSSNSFSVSVGGGWNDATAFQDFRYAKGGGTDFLGFDNGKRMFAGGYDAQLKGLSASRSVSLTGNGFNNDWRVKSMHPVADLSLGATLAQHWELSGHKLGLVGALNYSNNYRTQRDMENNLFGVYDAANDRSNYLRRFTDNQYNNNVRWGALLNLTFLSRSGNHKYELKNIFNQLATDRYTDREGYNAQSDYVTFGEYNYRSRTTYNLQLTGHHTLSADDKAEWGASYSYANRRMPDRRRYRMMLTGGVMRLESSNDIYREFTKLDEHIVSANAADAHQFHFGSFEPTLKVGAYGEWRTRSYKTREFIYNWEPAHVELLPSGFRTMDMTELLSDEQYFGEGGLYLLEQPKMTNDYDGHNLLGAGYVAATLPIGKLSIHGGVRYEFNQMELVRNLRDTERSPQSTYYRYRDLFPSVNATYKINDQHQVRLSYGRSVNRPEFREVSPSVYYDFDLASNVQGNYDLRSCYIDNIDLRYEFYPSRGEQITLAGFYKHFDSPIEWTYTVAGGTDLVYSYENAKSAKSLGVELDIRKRLDFIGLKDFSLSFNGALIHSRVNFNEGSRHHDRAMQGQSPYLVNAGIFYANTRKYFNATLLYNIIGKRIIGVGRSEGSEDNARVPDSYEMPRHSLDLSLSKSFLEGHLEIRARVRNLLGQSIQYKQWADVTLTDGTQKEVEQTVRRYNPGRDISLSVGYKF